MKQLISKSKLPLIDKLTIFFFIFSLFLDFSMKSSNITQLFLVIFFLFTLRFITLQNLFYNKFLFFYLIFIIFTALQLFLGLSVSFNLTFSILRTISINFVFLVAIFNFLSYFKNKINVAFLILIPFILIQFLGLLFYFYFDFPLRLNGDFNFYNLKFYLNANVFGFIQSLIIFILYYIISISKSKKISIIGSFLIILSFFMIFISGSRSSLLLPLVGLFLLYFFKPSNPLKKIRIFVLSILVIISTYFFIKEFFYETLFTRLLDVFNLVVNGEFDGSSADGSINARIKFIIYGFNFFMDKPFLGHGLDTFRTLFISAGTYSHSNFIEILFSGGISLFFIYYFPYFYNIFFLEKKKILYPLVFVFLFIDIFHITYFYREKLYFYFLIYYIIKELP
jgi:hypothetical protein